MSKINIKNIILCLVLIIPLKIATHFFLFKDVVAESMKNSRNGWRYPIWEWKYHSFEYHFYHTFNHKLWIFPIIIFTMIFILWYFDLYLIKKENPLNNNNKTKKQETVINQQIEKNENKSLNFKLDISKFPESTIKDINELDDEKKKQLLEATIFIDKDGFFDESKGQAKTILKGLEFISKLKGIKDDEVVFDIATFLRMGDEFPPVSDKDGKWYVKFGNMIQKSFSNKKFKTALRELLKANNIEEKIVACECSEDCYCSRKVRIDMRLGVVTQIFVGDGFEISYVIGKYNGNDVSEFIVKNPDVPIYIPKNKDGLRDYKVINFPGEFESYAKKLYNAYGKEDFKIIGIINTAEQDKQSLSYIHIEGKGLFSL